MRFLTIVRTFNSDKWNYLPTGWIQRVRNTHRAHNPEPPIFDVTDICSAFPSSFCYIAGTEQVLLLNWSTNPQNTDTCNFSPFPPLYYTYLLLRQQPPKLLKIYFLFTHGNCSLLIFSNSRVNCLSLTRRKKYCLKTGAQHWRTIHTSPLRKSWPGPLHHNTCKRIC